MFYTFVTIFNYTVHRASEDQVASKLHYILHTSVVISMFQGLDISEITYSMKILSSDEQRTTAKDPTYLEIPQEGPQSNLPSQVRLVLTFVTCHCLGVFWDLSVGQFFVSDV